MTAAKLEWWRQAWFGLFIHYGLYSALGSEEWVQFIPKHNEICATLQDGGWSYSGDARHIGPDEVWRLLGHAAAHDCNPLLNTGPLPDGSIHPADIATLRAAGKRIRQEGWPAAITEKITTEGLTPE